LASYFLNEEKNLMLKKLRKGFLLLLLLLLQISAKGQSWPVLQIKDDVTKKPVSFAKTKTQPQFYANEKGFLVLPENMPAQITISAWNFADTTINRNQLSQNDTVVIFLRPQTEQLNEVLVNPKNSWLQNKIYHFELWHRGWIFQFSKDLVITDDKLDILYRTPIPSFEEKAQKELFVDALLNLYVIGKDSVQQLYVTDSILYLYPLKIRKKFDYLIKPLIAQTEKGIASRQIEEETYDVNYLMRETGTYFEFELKYPRLHNCGLAILLESYKEDKLLYMSIDSSAYLAASNAYSKYVGAYISFWKRHEIDGVFDPALKEAYGLALHSYSTLFAQFKQVYIQALNNKYLLFDPYGNWRITFDQNLRLTEKEAFDFTNCPREEYLYTDQVTGKWWLQRRVRGLDQLESVRPGDPPESIILDPFVRNIRVHNNVVFYINERGQFRVKRIGNSNN
jgi:hypothetical protein